MILSLSIYSYTRSRISTIVIEIFRGTLCGFSTKFIKELAESALLHGMSATEENGAHEKWKLITYRQSVSYLFDTYRTDDIIAEAEADVINYKQPGNMYAVYYSETLWEKH